MAKPDKLENNEGSSEETPEDIAFKEAMSKIPLEQEAQDKPEERDEHEHAHEEESEKMLKDITKRADQVGGKPGERARKILEEVERSGRLNMQSPADFSAVFQSLEARKKYYPDWNLQEVQQLYEVLYGESLSGESFEDAQKNRTEAVEQAKQLEETIAKERAENEENESKKRQEEKRAA